MIWLIIGLALWVAAHFFKRLAPAARQAMADRMGDGSKGVIAVVLLVGLVLMVLGYRWSEFSPVYDPPSWGTHLNNLLMLIAVVLFGMGNSKSRLRGALRHPMLTGVIVWAVAHLLANGDLSSIVLFGGLGVWALAEIFLINASSSWQRETGGSVAGDVRLAVISLVVYAVIVGIHSWLGYYPFAG